jgi:hypothetical protein
VKLRTNVKAGKLAANHSQGLRVRTTVRAGKLAATHNQVLRSA